MAPAPSIPVSSSRRGTPRRRLRVLPRTGRLPFAAGAIAFLACIDPIDPNEFRIVGHIPPDILAGGIHEPQIPGTATVGVPLEITVWTFHWCAEDAGIEVSEHGGSAMVTPYISTLQTACTLITKPIEHKAEVVFSYARPSEIVLRYSKVAGGTWEANGTRVYDVMVSPGS